MKRSRVQYHSDEVSIAVLVLDSYSLLIKREEGGHEAAQSRE